MRHLCISRQKLASDVYDANGNTKTSTGVNYTYDFEDRLLSASSGVSFIHDGDGNRIVRTEASATTRFLVDHLTPTFYAQVAEEVASGAVLATYSYGLMRIAMNRDGALSYYGYDADGSVRQLLNNGGGSMDTWTYDAFGDTVARTGTTVNPFQYRGEQFDSGLGMYYLRARYYVPRTGRFLTADKYEPNELIQCSCGRERQVISNPRAHHLYEYAGADPVGYVDPSGQSFIEKGELLEISLATTRRAFSIARCINGIYAVVWRYLSNGSFLDNPLIITSIVWSAQGCWTAVF